MSDLIPRPLRSAEMPDGEMRLAGSESAVERLLAEAHRTELRIRELQSELDTNPAAPCSIEQARLRLHSIEHDLKIFIADVRDLRKMQLKEPHILDRIGARGGFWS